MVEEKKYKITLKGTDGIYEEFHINKSNMIKLKQAWVKSPPGSWVSHYLNSGFLAGKVSSPFFGKIGHLKKEKNSTLPWIPYAKNMVKIPSAQAPFSQSLYSF